MKILFLAGPALGHISRLLTVANYLKEHIDHINILFAVPDIKSSANVISESGFALTLIQTATESIHLNIFPKNVEKLCKNYLPDVIIVDWNMLLWASNIVWPNIPRILITNIFLTKILNCQTLQDEDFETHKDAINTARNKNGLNSLIDNKDLYDANLVYLADPCQLVNAYIDQLPSNFVNDGAIFFNPTIIPEEIDIGPIHENILISMGSTGLREISPDLIRSIKEQTKAKAIFWVGGEELEWFKDLNIQYFKMIPLQKILEKSILVITQGGSGSTYQALSHGAPVLIFPTHKNHEILGDILEEQGVGLSLRNNTVDLGEFKQISMRAKTWADNIRQEKSVSSILKFIKAINMRKFNFSNTSNITLKNNPDHQFALKHTLEIYKHNAAYTFIPKNACSTMRFTIAHENGCVDTQDDINWIHANNGTFSMSTSSATKASYTFVILRCPFERLFSAFMDKIVGLTNQAWNYHVAQGRKQSPYDITFDSFLNTLSKTPRKQMDIHWRPQKDFLLYKQYDDYFSLENFGLVESTLKKKLNIDIIDTRAYLEHDSNKLETDMTLENPNMISALNLLVLKRSGYKPDILKMYDQKNIDIVKKIYADDITLYNTFFESSKTMKRLLK